MGKGSLAVGSEFKVYYSYWTKLFFLISSPFLPVTQLADSPIRELDAIKIKKKCNKMQIFCNIYKIISLTGASLWEVSHLRAEKDGPQLRSDGGNSHS